MRYLKPGDIFYVHENFLSSFASFFSRYDENAHLVPVLMLALSVEEEKLHSSLQTVRVNLKFLVNNEVKTYYDIKSFSSCVQFID